MRGSFFRNLLLAGAWVSLLSACQAGPTPLASTPTQTPAAATQAPLQTPPTPLPAPTSESPRVLVVRPDAADAQVQAAETVLRELAGKSGMAVISLTALSKTDLTPSTRIVVAFPPDPGLAALAQGAPDVAFLGLGIPGLNPGVNLSVAGGDDLAEPAHRCDHDWTQGARCPLGSA